MDPRSHAVNSNFLAVIYRSSSFCGVLNNGNADRGLSVLCFISSY